MAHAAGPDAHASNRNHIVSIKITGDAWSFLSGKIVVATECVIYRWQN